VAQADSDGQGNTVGWWLKPAVFSKPTLPVCGSSQLCWSSYHGWLVAQASSVEQANTIGWRLKPAVLVEPSLLASSLAGCIGEGNTVGY
jgi:hypothetical protein